MFFSKSVKRGHIRMLEKVKKIPKSAILYLVLAIFMILAVSMKVNYYIDEIYTYGLSNYNGNGIDMEIEYDKTYTPGTSVYDDYMKVQNGQSFDYVNVWRNQTNDVHPPLYYALIHTICSIFPNKFSKWFAAGINIIFVLLTLYMVRKIINLFTDDKFILWSISLSFVTLSGIIMTATYFRMYCMATFWVTLLTCLFLKQVDEKQTRKFYLLTGLTTIAGALTHYYVIVYAFFLSVVYGIYLLKKKRYAETAWFCLTMGCAGGISIAVFPAMIKHIFFGYRGTEAIDNFKKSDNYWDNLKAFFQIVNSQLFGNILAYILIALFVLACVGMLQKYTDVLTESKMTKLSLPLDYKVKIRYILIFAPCVCYFMIVSKITFVNADRYMWPIYAIAFTAVMCLTCAIWRQVLKDGAFIVVTAMMIAVIAWGSFSSCGWQYLFQESQNLLAEAYAHNQYDCICVLEGESYWLYPEFAEYSNYKSITFVTADEIEQGQISNWADHNDGIVISYINYPGDRDENLNKLKEMYGYTGYEYLGTYGMDNTYFLHR